MAEQKTVEDGTMQDGVGKYIDDLREHGAVGIDSMEHGESYVISVGHSNVLDLISSTSYDYELLDDVPGDENRRRVMLKTK
ncbi:MAG: hypothetical protein U5J64_10110 [Halobacteriales archaeon]|nr:hypothetical protein [Halobacteriales archaeon]